MGVREDRLRAEFEAMSQFASDVMTWQVLGSSQPPDHYLFHYDLASLVSISQQGVASIERQIWQVEVKMPANYPWGKPTVKFKGPYILHPNVYVGGDVCIEDRYHAGIGIPLDSLCEHIGQIIAYQKYNPGSAANRDHQLLDWITKNGNDMLPTDSRDMRRARISFGNAENNQSTTSPVRIKFGS
jgi:ubiquitin-protein ligase